jgi:hypothetical protein
LEFGASIGRVVADSVRMLFRNRSAEVYRELIESYKDRILALEIENEYHKQQKDKYEQMLFGQLGLISDRVEAKENQKPIPRPLSLSRIRSSLELASRVAMKQEKK